MQTNLNTLEQIIPNWEKIKETFLLSKYLLSF